MDKRQDVFEKFDVPDPGRILKAIRLVKRHFPDVRGKKVLECGMANGGVAERLLREGAQCYGVDVNPRAIHGVEFQQADLNERIPDFGVSFDVIFAGEVMEHLYDDRGFLDECYKKLNPGGVLVITVPNLFFTPNRFLMIFGKMPFFAYEEYHYHFYSKKTLSGLFQDAGFEVTNFVSSHILFSSRRNPVGIVFEWLGDLFPSFGAHLIICGKKK